MEAQRRYRVLIERIRIRGSQALIITGGPKFKGASISGRLTRSRNSPRIKSVRADEGGDRRIKGMKWPGRCAHLRISSRSRKFHGAFEPETRPRLVTWRAQRTCARCLPRIPFPCRRAYIHSYAYTPPRAVYTRDVDRPWIHTADGCACRWYWIFHGRLNYTLPVCWNRSTARTLLLATTTSVRSFFFLSVFLSLTAWTVVFLSK